MGRRNDRKRQCQISIMAHHAVPSRQQLQFMVLLPLARTTHTDQRPPHQGLYLTPPTLALKLRWISAPRNRFGLGGRTRKARISHPQTRSEQSCASAVLSPISIECILLL